MWFFSDPDSEKYLSQKKQVNIVSTVFDIWFLVSSPETVILVSSILGTGLDDTARQDQLFPKVRPFIWDQSRNLFQDIVDKVKYYAALTSD